MLFFRKNNKDRELEEARRRQEELIKEQLKALDLENELKELENEKKRQGELVQETVEKKRQEKGERKRREEEEEKKLQEEELKRQRELLEKYLRPTATEPTSTAEGEELDTSAKETASNNESANHFEVKKEVSPKHNEKSKTRRREEDIPITTTVRETRNDRQSSPSSSPKRQLQATIETKTAPRRAVFTRPRSRRSRQSKIEETQETTPKKKDDQIERLPPNKDKYVGIQKVSNSGNVKEIVGAINLTPQEDSLKSQDVPTEGKEIQERERSKNNIGEIDLKPMHSHNRIKLKSDDRESLESVHKSDELAEPKRENNESQERAESAEPKPVDLSAHLELNKEKITDHNKNSYGDEISLGTMEHKVAIKTDGNAVERISGTLATLSERPWPNRLAKQRKEEMSETEKSEHDFFSESNTDIFDRSAFNFNVDDEKETQDEDDNEEPENSSKSKDENEKKPEAPEPSDSDNSEVESMMANLKELDLEDTALIGKLEEKFLSKVEDKEKTFDELYSNTEVDKAFVAELRRLMKTEDKVSKNEESESKETPRLPVFGEDKRGTKKNSGKKKKKGKKYKAIFSKDFKRAMELVFASDSEEESGYQANFSEGVLENVPKDIDQGSCLNSPGNSHSAESSVSVSSAEGSDDVFGRLRDRSLQSNPFRDDQSQQSRSTVSSLTSFGRPRRVRSRPLRPSPPSSSQTRRQDSYNVSETKLPADNRPPQSSRSRTEPRSRSGNSRRSPSSQSSRHHSPPVCGNSVSSGRRRKAPSGGNSVSSGRRRHSPSGGNSVSSRGRHYAPSGAKSTSSRMRRYSPTGGRSVNSSRSWKTSNIDPVEFFAQEVSRIENKTYSTHGIKNEMKELGKSNSSFNTFKGRPPRSARKFPPLKNASTPGISELTHSNMPFQTGFQMPSLTVDETEEGLLSTAQTKIAFEDAFGLTTAKTGISEGFNADFF